MTASNIVEIIAPIVQRRINVTSVKTASLWNRRQIQLGGEQEITYRLEVPAEVEPSSDDNIELCNTGIFLVAGDQVEINAQGTVTIDKNPETGIGATFPDLDGWYAHPATGSQTRNPTREAYHATGYPEDGGYVGSLVGWIGSGVRAREKAFFVGSQYKKELGRNEGGFLYLAVNDTKQMYHDNEGRFDVTIMIKGP
jgi:hypothetical protein